MLRHGIGLIVLTACVSLAAARHPTLSKDAAMDLAPAVAEFSDEQRGLSSTLSCVFRMRL